MEGKSDPYVQINLTSISHPGLNLTQKWSKGLKVHESTRRRYRRNTSDLDLVLAFCTGAPQHRKQKQELNIEKPLCRKGQSAE